MVVPPLMLSVCPDLRSAMQAGVEQRVKCPFLVAGKQDRAPRDFAGEERAGRGEFRGMAQIEPAAIKYRGLHAKVRLELVAAP